MGLVPEQWVCSLSEFTAKTWVGTAGLPLWRPCHHVGQQWVLVQLGGGRPDPAAGVGVSSGPWNHLAEEIGGVGIGQAAL